jgi:preprotein translocase subunit SecG
MQMLMNAVVVLQILAAATMIGLVLIQHGKGADMGASFGSGSAGSLFGATGSANFLSRSTAVATAIFFVCTLGLSYFSNHSVSSIPGGTVLDRVVAPAASAASAASVAAQIPGVVASASAVSVQPAASVAPASSAAK